MKKIISHLKENWIKYGFETFVIVVGILGAFMLNNWNEQRKENQFKNKLITDLVSIIDNDIEQLEVIINLQKTSRHSSGRILLDIEEQGSLLSKDSVGHYLGHGQVCFFTFYPQEGIFNLIANTDAIELIKTDGLISSMFELYDHDMERLKDNNRLMDDICQPYSRLIRTLGINTVDAGPSLRIIENSISKKDYLSKDLKNNVQWINNYSRSYISRLQGIKTKYYNIKKLCLMEVNKS